MTWPRINVSAREEDPYVFDPEQRTSTAGGVETDWVENHKAGLYLPVPEDVP